MPPDPALTGVAAPRRSLASRLKRFAPLGVGLGLVAAVLAHVDLARLGAALGQARWPWYLGAQAATLAYIILVSRRWQALLRLQGLALPFREVFLIYNAGSLAGAVTPGRLGDLARLLYFPRRQGILLPVTLSIVADRVLDLAALAGLSLLAVGFLPLPPALRHTVVLLIIGGLLAAAGLSLWLTRDQRRLAALLARLLPESWRERARQGLTDAGEAARRYLTPALTVPALLTLLAWSANAVGAYAIARSLQTPLTLMQAAAVLGLSTVFTLLPITSAGIGTRELSCIFLFAQLGLGREAALAFAFLLFGLVITHALIGWLCLARKPPAGREEAHVPAG